MLFSSPVFFLFFPIYFALHLLVPANRRVYLIIGGSTIFYAWWRTEYFWVPFLLAGTAYVGDLLLSDSPRPAARKFWLVATIATLLCPLLFFKYTNFIYGKVLGGFFGWHGELLNLPLPLGVSFITFTLIAYVVDTYRQKFGTRRKLSTVLAYVLFFPHLIAGPILRPAELIPQLERPRRATLRRLAGPTGIFTAGLVKKLVFADQIGDAVNRIYASHTALGAPDALLAIYGFSVQIYCDFSAYTDMAIALAMMLSIRLPNNFRQPYGAVSLVDFWRRWHITLSFWLRDYLYISLGGARRGELRRFVNIVITMALGGLWHGANWTFVLWGLVHGLGVSLVHLWQRLSKINIPTWLATLITFHFVTFSWILFRSPDLEKAGQIFRAPIFGDWNIDSVALAKNSFIVALIVVALAIHRFDDHRRIRAFARRLRPELFWPIIAVFWILAITLSQGSSDKFIYFDF